MNTSLSPDAFGMRGPPALISKITNRHCIGKAMSVD